MEANIETRESTREKARAALGLDLSSALDLVSRSDYDSGRLSYCILVLLLL